MTEGQGVIMDLNIFWFVLLGVLMAGYAILDGFDFGVGILHPWAKNDQERRVFMNSIGPLWDGNEVWLVTFGGALFAAFPRAYATMFSGLYTAFMLLVLCLILRAVSMEFRSKTDVTGLAVVLGLVFLRLQLDRHPAFRGGRGQLFAGIAHRHGRRTTHRVLRSADTLPGSRGALHHPRGRHARRAFTCILKTEGPFKNGSAKNGRGGLFGLVPDHLSCSPPFSRWWPSPAPSKISSTTPGPGGSWC
jgi:hypothetical protein